jgi:hypothetical protein
MNRDLIKLAVFTWKCGQITMDDFLDQIEAEFARAHGKLHSDNLDLKNKVARLEQTIHDLHIQIGGLRITQITNETKISELVQEQGEIVGWVNVFKDPNGSLVFSDTKPPDYVSSIVKSWLGYVATVPIRLPAQKEEPKPEPVPFSRDDFVAMTPEQLEFARELTEPEEGIPESVRAHLELLRKQAGWQCGPTVAEHEIANWFLANLRNEVIPMKPVKKETWKFNIYRNYSTGRYMVFDVGVEPAKSVYQFIREISGEEEV